MNPKEMLEEVQRLKEESILMIFEKPEGVDKFFNEHWIQILDILDDALYRHINGKE